MPRNSNLLLEVLATVEAALRGETGIDMVDDYRGVPVYSAYQRFDFEGIHWAVLAEQDVAEIREPIIRARWWLLGGVFLSVLIVFVLRHMLVRVVLPSSIAALLGLTFVSMESQADD